MASSSDYYKQTGKRTSLSADDPSASAAAKGFGGVYLGPGSGGITFATAGSPPERTSSQKKKKEQQQQQQQKEQQQQQSQQMQQAKRGSKVDEKILKDLNSPTSAENKQVWGGVYVGPASDMANAAASAASAASACTSTSTSKMSASKLIRTLSSSSKSAAKDSPRPSTSAASPQPPPQQPPSSSTIQSTPAGTTNRNSMRGGKVRCEICKKKCVGDVIRADEKHFHLACFTCKACNRALGDVGYFVQDGEYYCPTDYHQKFGRTCPTCQKFVEGDVVQLMDRVYHQQCFRCDRCRQPFPPGQKVTYNGRETLCQRCVSVPVAKVKPTQLSQDDQAQYEPEHQHLRHQPGGLIENEQEQEQLQGYLSPPGLASPTTCASCNQLIHSGQVLLALDAQWHIWCFKCTACGSVLHGEYMAKDGYPYCIRDYNAQFGVKCDECGKYIAGRVLQAGNYHFHPTCARCTRCSQPFEDGEEMYMQGDEIWHSRCNDIKAPETILHTHTSSSTASHHHHAPSQQHGSQRSPYPPKFTLDFGKHLTFMYLLPEPNMGYLKQPISPHPPQTPQFHTPQAGAVKIRKSRISMFKSGMQKLAEALDEQTPRPHSPYMNNEEPIEMSHFPSGRVPDPETVPAIERDDFPAPPFPYAVEEIKRRLSSSDVEEDEDYPDAAEDDRRRQKIEDELKKYENESSIAKVVIHDLAEQAKKVKAPLHWDPRSASRTPSAKKLPHLRCRYESPINASPSRYLNRPRPWEYWDKSNRAATVTVPIPHMAVPKPGYGLAPKSATLPGGGANGYFEIRYGELDTTQSTDFSEHSFATTTPSFVYDRYQPSYASGVIRTSLPDMSKPPKIYTYRELLTSNKKMPEDVDRCHLERHLNKDEFERLFNMTPIEFYKLPDWKRVNLKRKLKLF